MPPHTDDARAYAAAHVAGFRSWLATYRRPRAKPPTTQIVLDRLAAYPGPATVAQIIQATGLADKTVRKALAALADNGRIRQVLPPADAPALHNGRRPIAYALESR